MSLNESFAEPQSLSLHVYLTFFQNPSWSSLERAYRTQFLATSIFYLSQLKVSFLKVKVFSNLEIQDFNNICAPIESRGRAELALQKIVTSKDLLDPRLKIEIPWLLTWAHKKTMFSDFQKSPQGSRELFLVLEDDAIFTQANLDYFLEYLSPLKRLGLIPGFMRAEWSRALRTWVHPDSFERMDFASDTFEYPFNKHKILSQRNNPFSASILFDRELCNEYFESESSDQQIACFKHPYIFDIGSTATLGLIAESVPPGYKCRTAVVLDAHTLYPEPGSVIRHQGDKYANDPWQAHYRLYDHPDMHPLIKRRTLADLIKRLLKPDRFIVLKKYFLQTLSRRI